jgi:Dna[CI] antecedent, DciA
VRKSGLNQHLKELLPSVLGKIGSAYQERPDLVLAAWPEIIGPKLAPMTEALSFVEGVLTVKVRHSTLYSLLRQYERDKLLRQLREKFPGTAIKRIAFRMG